MEKGKNQRKWGVAAILIVVVWVLGGMLGSSLLIDEGYSRYFGDDAVWVLTGNMTCIPTVLIVVFAVVCIWLFWPYGAFGNLWTGEKGARAKLPGRMKTVIAVLALYLLILGSVISMFWYERYSMDGVEVCRFGKKIEYTWEDAESFALKRDFHGVLVFEVAMKDGRKYGFNGGFWHAVEYESSAYREKFPDGSYDYTVWLARELAGHQVTMDVSQWDRLKKGLAYDSWKELADEIRTAYEEAVE